MNNIHRKFESISSGQIYLQKIKSYLMNQFSLEEPQVTGMLPAFVATLESHMNMLETDFKKGDLVALGKAGHTMKGALVNLGLHEYAELACDIEEGAKKDDGTIKYEKLLSQLREVVTAIAATQRN